MSECMLQQTQVDRVVPIFEAFVARFPSFEALAAAPAGAVVRAWHGLGYNGRAVRLHALARTVCSRYRGVPPEDAQALRELPGVGRYTAGAIRAFAYGIPDIALDTNVKRVLERVFYGSLQDGKASRALETAGGALLEYAPPFSLNSALMDLGATLCTARRPKCVLCPLSFTCAAAGTSTSHERTRFSQTAASERVPFRETSRYLRGRIVDVLRALPPGTSTTLASVHKALARCLPSKTRSDVAAAATALVRDGIIVRRRSRLSLAD
ncbi:MAG: A/G-specific adenine glycosylase [Candidatus Eremiobacteraeota bacterium]|nr:A/G-specific adenine glycosylase [Candidatus Eremiobacteraeota bacterium]